MTDQQQTKQFVDAFWEETIVPTITDYIRIPNVSSMFDPNWQENGHVERALELVQSWLEVQKPEGTTLHVGRLDDRQGARSAVALEVEQVGERPGVATVRVESARVGVHRVAKRVRQRIDDVAHREPPAQAKASSPARRLRTRSTSSARRRSSQPQSSAMRSATGSAMRSRASGS